MSDDTLPVDRAVLRAVRAYLYALDGSVSLQLLNQLPNPDARTT